MIKIEELSKCLLNEKSVAIFCHIRPDGDAIGSLLSLKHALNKMGVLADAYCDDAVPKKFNFLNGATEISNELHGEYTALIAVDCAEMGRLGKFQDLFAKNNFNTYNIDHHISNARYAKINYVGDKPSNCENVYDLIVQMNCDIDGVIANALATGIMTDSGNFNHKDVPADTLLTASKLVEKGADLNDISYRMFNAQSKERAKLFGMVMSRIRFFLDDRFGVATVFKSDLESSGARRDETEGFVDFVMNIDTVKVGACIMEMDNNIYKISLRSKGADVSKIAGVFGGGGHKLASGCQIRGDYEEVIDKVRYAVSQYLED